tara:strand:- start:1844 stop:2086 length:243 start_codon:yes stop_codon:yes gene_type:complete
MLEILSDIIQNSEMSNSAVQNERRVILTELSEVNARSEEYIFDLLHSACFQGTPLGYTILGKPVYSSPYFLVRKLERLSD